MTGDRIREFTKLAGKVYREFLREVVDGHVLPERVDELSEKQIKGIESGKKGDGRFIRLMTISGKGGWSPDPELSGRYARNMNITLMDHLLSVVRGGLMLAALDIAEGNPDIDVGEMEPAFRVIAAVGFLHDPDKIAGLRRGAALSPELIRGLMIRYGLFDFCSSWESFDEYVMLAMIALVEDTQSHRYDDAGARCPSALAGLAGYIRLADKLDGAWTAEGISGVVDRLERDGNIYCQALRKWKEIRLADPHHPFLLDEVQSAFSAVASRVTGAPPLFETHHDGILSMLVRADAHDEIVEKGTKMVVRCISRELFALDLRVSSKGIPELLNRVPEHDELIEFFREINSGVLRGLFRIKTSLRDPLDKPLWDMLAGTGMDLDWGKGSGATIPLFANPSGLECAGGLRLRQCAHLVTLLNHGGKIRGVPSCDEREGLLLERVCAPRPDWIEGVSDGGSRRVLTALWVTALASGQPDLEERIWGDGGFLSVLLCGDEASGAVGVRDLIHTREDAILSELESYLHCRLAGGFWRPSEPERVAGHCLFTGEPLGPEWMICSADDLYEVKSSAFSGRDGRREDLVSSSGETYVGPISMIEHKLRSKAFAGAGGRSGGVPTLISAPATTGLFSALVFEGEMGDHVSLSTYDLLRTDMTGGKRVYLGTESYKARYRVARFERMPEKLVDQVDFIDRVLRASIRFGRPIHVFRGLPHPRKEFFHFDAMPRLLRDLLGGDSLRIEQIVGAGDSGRGATGGVLDRIRIARLILSTPGLGHDVFQMYVCDETRLGAIAMSIARLDGSGDAPVSDLIRLRDEFTRIVEENAMSETVAPFIELGRLAARIQRCPLGQGSNNERALVYDLCLQAAVTMTHAGLKDPEEMRYAITGELGTSLVRRGKAAAKANRDDMSLEEACDDVAKFFVEKIWYGVFKGRTPSQALRRLTMSAHSISFMNAHRAAADSSKENLMINEGEEA